MLRLFARLLARLTLGPAARAARPKLDADAMLAMAPRQLENVLPRQVVALPRSEGRKVGHLTVYEGGRQGGAARPGSGPLGGPAPVPFHGNGNAARRA